MNFFLIIYWNGSLCVMGCIHNPPILPGSGFPQTQTEPSALKKDMRKEREDVWPCVGASPLTKVFRKQKCFSGLSDGHICVTSVIQHHKVRLGRWSWSPAMDPEECGLTSRELETAGKSLHPLEP